MQGNDPSAGTELRALDTADGRIWLGFDQGEFGVLGADGRVRRIPPAPGTPPRLQSVREVLEILPVPASGTMPATVYAAGTGIFRVDLATMTYKPVDDPLISGEVVSSLAADGNRLWAGTYNGLYTLDRVTGKSNVLRHDPNDTGSLPEDDVRALLKGSDNKLWMSTRRGLAVLDLATGRFTALHHVEGDPTTPASDNVRSLLEDHEGHLWVATIDEGLSELWKYDAGGKPVFRTLNRASGMPSDTMQSLSVSRGGRIWVNTPGGLAVIDPRTLTVKIYGEVDGLRDTSQKLTGSAVLDDGALLLRSVEGLTVVRPADLVHREISAPLVLTRFESYGRPTNSTVAANRAETNTLVLDPHHRGFHADFALLDFTAADSTRYRWMLEGFDRQWATGDADQRSAAYNDLPAGNYILRLQALDGFNGRVTAETTYRIDAPRAWSQTIWFRGTLVFLLIGDIFLLVRLRTAYLVLRRRQLEKVIEERTIELDEKRMQLELANAQLSRQATRDPLTNIFNRRHFHELAELEMVRSRRNRRSFSMLLMDIDHFKQVNDIFGHVAGDIALRAVAERAAALLRETDIIARYGGEEFIVLLPETEISQAVVLAERIRAEVERRSFEIGGRPAPLTLSIGCAEADPMTSVADVIERSDRALYAAKRAGRNRVCIDKHPCVGERDGKDRANFVSETDHQLDPQSDPEHDPQPEKIGH